MPPILARLLAFNRRIPIFVVGLWALLYGARPFQLGFYHDDWWTFIEPIHGNKSFSLGRLAQFVGAQTSWGARPFAGINAFLLSSMANSSPFIYHLCAIFLVLGAALSMRAWLITLPAVPHPHVNLAADLAVLAWLSYPWAIAASAFLTIAPQAMPAQILITEAARRYCPPREFRVANLWKLGAMLVISYLTYESFYFIFVFIAIFGIFFHWKKFQHARQALAFLGVVCAAQVVAIGGNRLLAHLNPRGSKALAANWLALFRGSLRVLPEQLPLTIVESRAWWMWGLYALAAGAVVLLVVACFRASQRRAAAGAIGIFVMGAVSLVTITATYSLASYGYTAKGVEARTLHGASWAMTVMLFAVLSTMVMPGKWGSVWRVLPLGFVKVAMVAASITVIFLHAVSQKAALGDWIYVWNQEQAVLKNAPLDTIKGLPADAQVLFIGPGYYHDLVIFGAEWDITAAVFAAPELSRGREAFQGLKTIFPATEMYSWRWDGKQLTEELPQYWTRTFPATRLYIWDYWQKRVYEASPGFEHLVK